PDGYPVRLPEGTREQFALALASYREPPPPPITYSAARRGTTHRVQRGETLSRIARRYGVSVQALQRANGISRARALRTGQRRHIPGAAPVRVAAASARSKQSASKQRTRTTVAAKAPAKRHVAKPAKRPAAAAKKVSKPRRAAATAKKVRRQ